MRHGGTIIRTHGPILGLLAFVVYLVFHRLCMGDFWHPVDFTVLLDTHRLSQNPWAGFQHIGTWFSQPLLQLAFLFQFNLFEMNYGAYIAVNLLLHTLCTFVIYMLVNMLFHQRSLALTAAILFALNVGSYGRNLQTLAGQESLLLALLHLLVLYLFIRNDFRHDGRLRSPLFLIGLALYCLTGLTRASTLSLMGCLIAYKFFFYKRRGRRPIFSNDLLVFLAVGILFKLGQNFWGFQQPTMLTEVDGPLAYTYWSVVDLFRYLNLMVFPLQEGSLLREAGALLQFLHDIRMLIRALLTLGIISFSFFGFVFGNQALRFFIAWTYITIIPLSTRDPGAHWLNVTYLYLASVGFCLILAAGALGCMKLLKHRRWRRFVPFVVPLFFVVVSVSLTYRLNARNREKADLPEIQEMRRETLLRIQHPPEA